MRQRSSDLRNDNPIATLVRLPKVGETELPDDAVLTLMVSMTLADGEIDAAEVTRIQWIYGRLTQATVDEATVRAKIAAGESAQLDLPSYLRSIEPKLSEEAKRRMLEAAFAIASADGRVLEEEDALLVSIARALAIGPELYRTSLSNFALARDVLRRGR